MSMKFTSGVCRKSRKFGSTLNCAVATRLPLSQNDKTHRKFPCSLISGCDDYGRTLNMKDLVHRIISIQKSMKHAVQYE